jgi:hypothetical protein
MLLSLGYGPYLASGLEVPAMARLAWKLPILLGNLVVPWLARSYLERRRVPWPKAQRAEMFLLFNPFLILIGAVWGMFDIWVFAFLLASVLALERGRPGWAGVTFALAILTKPYAALLLLPLAATLPTRRALIAFFGGLVATATVTLAPFLHVWDGLVAQSVTLHTLRPPQGFMALGIPLFIEGVAPFVDADVDPWHLENLAGIYGLATMILLALVLALTYFIHLRGAVERNRVPGMAVVLFLFLILTKVVNEQFFVPALGFLVLLAHDERTWISERARRTARWLTWAGSAAVLLVGFHFATLVPPDVAARAFGTDPDAVVGAIANASGIPRRVFYGIPSVTAFVLMLPVFLAFASLAFAYMKNTFHTPKAGSAAGRSTFHVRARELGVAVAMAVILVLPVVAAGVVLPPRQEPGIGRPYAEEAPTVGVFYYTWWNNPSHRPDLRYGPWLKASATPEEGYYALNSRYIELDLVQIRKTGVDFVVVSYEDRDVERLRAVVRTAEHVGLKVTVLWELGIFYRDPANRPQAADGATLGPGAGFALRDDTSDRMADALGSIPRSIWSSPAWLRAEGQPVFLLYDAFFASPGFAPAERDFVVDALFSQVAEKEIQARWGGPVEAKTLRQAYPSTMRGFHGEESKADFWRWAYLEAYKAYWNRTLADAEARIGPATWYAANSWDPARGFHHGVAVSRAGTGVFDASFIYSPAALWPEREDADDDAIWADLSSVIGTMASEQRSRGRPVIATVMPAYDDTGVRDGFRIPADAGRTYARTWDAAMSVDPDLVLITSWNEHFEGTGIEPTKEHGDRFLDMTSERIRAYRDVREGPDG